MAPLISRDKQRKDSVLAICFKIRSSGKVLVAETQRPERKGLSCDLLVFSLPDLLVQESSMFWNMVNRPFRAGRVRVSWQRSNFDCFVI